MASRGGERLVAWLELRLREERQLLQSRHLLFADAMRVELGMPVQQAVNWTEPAAKHMQQASRPREPVALIQSGPADLKWQRWRRAAANASCDDTVRADRARWLGMESWRRDAVGQDRSSAYQARQAHPLYGGSAQPPGRRQVALGNEQPKDDANFGKQSAQDPQGGGRTIRKEAAVADLFARQRPHSAREPQLDDVTLMPEKKAEWIPRRRKAGQKACPNIEPKHLNFSEMCQAAYPERTWHQLNIKEQVELISGSLVPEHWLLDPHSVYMRYWDVVIMSLLVFVSLVTPYEVAFSTSQDVTPLFCINRIVDLLFLVDVIMNFHLKVKVKQPRSNGFFTLRDPRLVRQNYLKGWFAIDTMSFLPVEIIMIALNSDGTVSGLRALRFVKLLRVFRGARLIDRWKDVFTLSFANQELLKLVLIVCVASHWMACAWGLAGRSLGQSLCDGGEQVVLEPPPPAGSSWMTSLFLGGKRSPDDPCSAPHVYAASLHWAVMTITSIGYGDIAPVRYEEYIVAVICQILGSMVWVYIIGCSCAILSNCDPVEAHFEESTDLLNDVLGRTQMPQESRQIFRQYLREKKKHDAKILFRDLARGFSPVLRGYLMSHMTSQWTPDVPYLRGAPVAFLIELCDRIQQFFYARREPLNEIRHHLCIVERGSVAHGGKILTCGKVFQQDMIVTNRRLQNSQPTVSLTYCELGVLGRPSLELALERFPHVEPRIRRAAALLALRRVVLLCAEQAKATVASQATQKPSLLSAFGLLDARSLQQDSRPASSSSQRPGGAPQAAAVELARTGDLRTGQRVFGR